MFSKETSAYYDRLQSPRTRGDSVYTAANLALSELRSKVNSAIEPAPWEVTMTKRLFEESSQANMTGDAMAAFRSSMIGAYAEPIMWADLLAMKGLTTSEARKAGEKLRLIDAGDSLAQSSALAMKKLRILRKKEDENPTETDENRVQRIIELHGFLSEATVVLLGSRHNTAKIMTLPSLQYEDSLDANKQHRADGFLYDNRMQSSEHKFAYQVKTRPSIYDWYMYEMPLITAEDLGNDRASSDWPNGAQYFETMRQLIIERQANVVDKTVSSNLDRIWNRVQNKIIKW